ncbi:MAG: hypothetical protein JWQ57_1787 [Mucilaginibacter sp.]|nr:hypothetical protein [Mucilaginibacter sp.]
MQNHYAYLKQGVQDRMHELVKEEFLKKRL